MLYIFLSLISSNDSYSPEDQIFALSLRAIDHNNIKKHELNLKLSYRGDVAPKINHLKKLNFYFFNTIGLKEKELVSQVKIFFDKIKEDYILISKNIEQDILFLRRLFWENGVEPNFIHQQRCNLLQELMIEELKNQNINWSNNELSLEYWQEKFLLSNKIKDITNQEVYLMHEIFLKMNFLNKNLSFFNNIDCYQKFQGKVIEVLEWSFLLKKLIKKIYYVSDLSNTSLNEFGEPEFNIVLIKLDKDFNKVYDNLIEQIKQGSLVSGDFLDKSVVVKRPWQNSLLVNIKTREDLIFDNYYKEVKISIKKYLIDYYNQKIKKYLKEIYDNNFYNLTPENFSNKKGFFETDLFKKIPEFAQKLATFSKEEKEAQVVELANNQEGDGYGFIWSYQLLSSLEKYGYRNNIHLYEYARIRNLSSNLPLNAKKKFKSVDPKSMNQNIQLFFNKKEFFLLKLLCDGNGVKFIYYNQDNKIEKQREVLNVKIQSQEVVPSIDLLIETLKLDFNGIEEKDALSILEGLTLYVDETSFENLKIKIKNLMDSFSEKDEQFSLLNKIYQNFIDYNNLINKVTSPFSSRKKTFLEDDNSQIIEVNLGEDTVEAYQSDNDGFLKAQPLKEGSFKETLYEVKTSFNGEREQIAEQIFTEYNKINGFNEKKLADLTHKQIAWFNLINPWNENHRKLDRVVKRLKLDLELLDIGRKIFSEHEDHHVELEQYTNCKLCGKPVSIKRSVAGMGHDCAKKLANWVKESYKIENIKNKKFKPMSEYNQEDDDLPLVLVRNKETGRVFAADLRKKEIDGRYHVIDLTETDKLTKIKGNGSVILQASQVFFDPKDHEISVINLNEEKKKI